MMKIPLSQHGKNKGKFFVLVDDEDYKELNKYNWHLRRGPHTFYAIRNDNHTTVYMHRILTKAKIGQLVDHRDLNGLNNQKYNLRICNQAENIRNGRRRQNNTLGFKGVTFHKKTKKYQARVGYENKRVYLGLFNTPIEAAKIYNRKAIELYGEFARINIIPGENAS